MAEFKFCCTSYLGFSHCGEVTADGYGTVELSDDEVSALVSLMREKGSTDVKELDLEASLPEVYKKLDEAFKDAAWIATLDHWYVTGYEDGVYEYDADAVMDYCAENCGFMFEDEELAEELDEDSLWDDRHDAFEEWFDSYIYDMLPQERIAFLQEHMNAEVELSEDDLDYEVEIPDGVIQLM